MAVEPWKALGEPDPRLVHSTATFPIWKPGVSDIKVAFPTLVRRADHSSLFE